MESLSEETWDVVIAGTSLPQSLLALALSKCDVKVLHVDTNDYYGGLDAGLSLSEAEKWIQNKQETEDPTQFYVSKSQSSTTSLGPSRAYTIALRPQIIYAKSRFLPTLVSSQIHSQLEFQAVGSFWVHAGSRLQKIPSNREDVFADDTISVRDKRRLMGLLRYVLEEQDQTAAESVPSTLEARLKDQFKLPDSLRPPVQALTLSTDTLSNVQFDGAMARLKLHLASMGYFGPGLAAVMAKYGGNAEIAQVACRAGAVGGFVYLLGHGLDTIEAPAEEAALVSVKLTDGTTVKSKYVVGAKLDLPREDVASPISSNEGNLKVANQISIISGSLRRLFASTSENGPVPAVTIVLVDDGSSDMPPVYLQVHSEDTGECPNGQYIIYASCVDRDNTTKERLEKAVSDLIATTDTGDPAQLLWSIYFVQHEPATGHVSSPVLEQDALGKVLIFPQRTHDIAFDDTILDSVKAAWERVLGERSAEYDFLRFEERRDDDEGA